MNSPTRCASPPATDQLERNRHACQLHVRRRGRPGHEVLGSVEDAGSDVTKIKKDALVIAPFAWSDGSCGCHEGLHTSCRHGGFWNAGDVGGGQAEAVRVPKATEASLRRPGRE